MNKFYVQGLIEELSDIKDISYFLKGYNVELKPFNNSQMEISIVDNEDYYDVKILNLKIGELKDNNEIGVYLTYKTQKSWLRKYPTIGKAIDSANEIKDFIKVAIKEVISKY